MTSGKLDIATVIETDVSEVEKYQNERGVYYVGDIYYTSRKVGKGRLPEGYDLEEDRGEVVR